MECPHCHNQVRTHARKCQKCGGAIPSGQYLLEECGLTGPAPPVAPPKTTSPTHPDSRFRRAILGDRFLAFVLDIGLLFGLLANVDARLIARSRARADSDLLLTGW